MKNSIIKLYSKILYAVEKIKLWLNKPKWLNRYSFYSIFFCIFIILFKSLLQYYNLVNNNPESARYMLSALVQSEAAIIAIVITISLVAVQLTAQSYSIRVIEIFKRTPDLWILIGIYIFAMIYGSSVLRLIGIVSITKLDIHISFAYALGIFSFMVLIPYILNILILIKPSTIIDIFFKEFDDEKKLYVFARSKEKFHSNDLLSPIIDVLRSSLMKYDIETTIYCLGKIRNQFDRILENNAIEEIDKERIIKQFLLSFLEIGKLTISKEHESIALEITSNLLYCGKTVAKKKFTNLTWLNIYILGEIGKSSAKVGLLSVTDKSIISLRSVGIIALKNKLKYPTFRTVILLREIGNIAVEYKFEKEIKEVIKSFREIEKIAVKNEDYKSITHEIEKSIGIIEKEVIMEKMKNVRIFKHKEYLNLCDNWSDVGFNDFA